MCDYNDGYVRGIAISDALAKVVSALTKDSHKDTTEQLKERNQLIDCLIKITRRVEKLEATTETADVYL